MFVHQIISELCKWVAVAKTNVSLSDGDYVNEFLMSKEAESTLPGFFCAYLFPGDKDDLFENLCVIRKRAARKKVKFDMNDTLKTLSCVYLRLYFKAGKM